MFKNCKNLESGYKIRTMDEFKRRTLLVFVHKQDKLSSNTKLEMKTMNTNK